MKYRLLDNRWKTGRYGAVLVALALSAVSVRAQEQHGDPNVRLGQKALLDGDFKAAAAHLQKALPAEADNLEVLYLLGYSQFQNGDFVRSIETFEKMLALDSLYAPAWYYKAKVANHLAVSSGDGADPDAQENLLKEAIEDYGKAIAINGNDIKLYQNRAIAYRDLGILTGTEGMANYNKQKATDAYDRAIADYKKVLTYDASRKDIQTEIKKATVYRDNLK